MSPVLLIHEVKLELASERPGNENLWVKEGVSRKEDVSWKEGISPWNIVIDTDQENTLWLR